MEKIKFLRFLGRLIEKHFTANYIEEFSQRFFSSGDYENNKLGIFLSLGNCRGYIQLFEVSVAFNNANNGVTGIAIDYRNPEIDERFKKRVQEKLIELKFFFGCLGYHIA